MSLTHKRTEQTTKPIFSLKQNISKYNTIQLLVGQNCDALMMGYLTMGVTMAMVHSENKTHYLCGPLFYCGK